MDEAELQTLQDRAEFFGLDKADTFEDYKKKYLKAETLKNSGNSGIIKSIDVDDLKIMASSKDILPEVANLLAQRFMLIFHKT